MSPFCVLQSQAVLIVQGLGRIFELCHSIANQIKNRTNHHLKQHQNNSTDQSADQSCDQSADQSHDYKSNDEINTDLAHTGHSQGRRQVEGSEGVDKSMDDSVFLKDDGGKAVSYPPPLDNTPNR